MNKDDAQTVDNKDDILLVAQAAAECLEDGAKATDSVDGDDGCKRPVDFGDSGSSVSASRQPQRLKEQSSTKDETEEKKEEESEGKEEQKKIDEEDDDDSSSSSSSSSDDDDDDDLFMRPMSQTRSLARKRPSSKGEDEEELKEKGEPQAASTGDDEEEDDDEDDDDDDSDGERNKKNKADVSVVKTKNEVSRSELPEPEPWPDKIDPNEPVEHVGTLCHCIDDIVTVQALPPSSESDATSRAIDEGSILCFEDRTVLGRVDEVFGQVSQPFYAIRFGKTRKPDSERCKPGTKVYMATEHTTFVCIDQVMLDRGSDASNIYDEEPAPEELDYSDDEEEARAKSLLKQQRQAKRARMTLEELQEQLRKEKLQKAQKSVPPPRRYAPHQRQPPLQQQPQWQSPPPSQSVPVQLPPMVAVAPPQPPQQPRPSADQVAPAMMFAPAPPQTAATVPFNGYVPQYCIAPAGMAPTAVPAAGMAPMVLVMVPPNGQLPPGAVVMQAPSTTANVQQQPQALPYGMYYLPPGMQQPPPPR